MASEFWCHHRWDPHWNTQDPSHPWGGTYGGWLWFDCDMDVDYVVIFFGFICVYQEPTQSRLLWGVSGLSTDRAGARPLEIRITIAIVGTINGC